MVGWSGGLNSSIPTDKILIVCAELNERFLYKVAVVGGSLLRSGQTGIRFIQSSTTPGFKGRCKEIPPH